MAIAAILAPAGKALAAAAGASGDTSSLPMWALVVLWLISIWSLLWLTAEMAKRTGMG